MKAYDIIKVTAELKSYYIQYRNKKVTLLDVLVQVGVDTGSTVI